MSRFDPFPRERPDVEEARAAAMRIVKDGTRVGEIISRIRLLFKKGTPERVLVDVNEVIRAVFVLLRGEAMRYNISVRTELAADLPEVMGDRVQLQQVLMNLMINGIDAMKDVARGGGLWAAHNFPRGASFTSLYPPKSRRMNDAR